MKAPLAKTLPFATLPSAADFAQADADDAAAAAHSAEMLARFGEKLGRHGPLATCTRPMMLRIPRDAFLDLVQLSGEVGPRPATLATELVIIAAHCPPAKWHQAVATFQQSCKS